MLKLAVSLPKLPSQRVRVATAAYDTMKDEICEILTLDDVAAYLKVGKRTVYRLAAAKKIPAFKVGGTWRFSRADIDMWIKQQSMDGLSARQTDDIAKNPGK